MGSSNKITFRKLLFGVFFCGLGFVASALLQFEFAPYLSSAMVGFSGSFLPLGKGFYNQKEAVASIYTGSFAAMTATQSLNSLASIMLISIVAGLLFALATHRFRGYGGKLGSIAFISSFILVLLEVLL